MLTFFISLQNMSFLFCFVYILVVQLLLQKAGNFKSKFIFVPISGCGYIKSDSPHEVPHQSHRANSIVDKNILNRVTSKMELRKNDLVLPVEIHVLGFFNRKIGTLI